ncbi:sugar transferase [Liquorilactobacillus satsumensis]|uniref:Galactofuranosyltransferase n=1 Tax=Liquorilactobacillus satsumensis DSM 16230 = JCM 12392 TaxID=1423801 RepID=A0A0R1UZC7_9LACO|nr:sugar transferase [Liquorilactobacillus satsumensis]KRL98672.1 hypothetical protein FD50_GL000479 [Liquorilactobacillus satsumensis DSM 16230 = JCM 12392]MCP9328147.1 sugar transferase [Liquorilactobacillus satsumensis]
MRKIITLETDKTKQFGGGSKANEDIAKFLKSSDFKTLSIEIAKSKLLKLFYSFFKIPRLIKKENGNLIVFQYPLHTYLISRTLVRTASRSTNTKLIILIHDIQSLQFFEGDAKKTAREVELFNMADTLVVHNEEMARWLREQGVKKEMVSLEIFDYDNPQPVQNNFNYKGSVCFAGNLAKSSFLEKLNLKHKIYIFGPNAMNNSYAKCVQYCGKYSPEELPKYLNQNFGLVWDGSSTETCAGVYGNYLRYNNPHKVSLYLSTGIPVVVWSGAAIAKFVEKYKVGITIDNLDELDEILGKISASEYNQLKKNTLNVALKMRKGYFVKKALAKLTESI